MTKSLDLSALVTRTLSTRTHSPAASGDIKQDVAVNKETSMAAAATAAAAKEEATAARAEVAAVGGKLEELGGAVEAITAMVSR